MLNIKKYKYKPNTDEIIYIIKDRMEKSLELQDGVSMVTYCKEQGSSELKLIPLTARLVNLINEYPAFNVSGLDVIKIHVVVSAISPTNKNKVELEAVTEFTSKDREEILEMFGLVYAREEELGSEVLRRGDIAKLLLKSLSKKTDEKEIALGIYKVESVLNSILHEISINQDVNPDTFKTVVKICKNNNLPGSIITSYRRLKTVGLEIALDGQVSEEYVNNYLRDDVDSWMKLLVHALKHYDTAPSKLVKSNSF